MITRKQTGFGEQHQTQPTAFAIHEQRQEKDYKDLAPSENFVFSPDAIPAKQIHPPVGAALKSSKKNTETKNAYYMHEQSQQAEELFSGSSSSVTEHMWGQQPVDELIKSSEREMIRTKDLRPSSELLDSGEGTGYDSKGHMSSTSQTKTYTQQATLSVNHPDGGESSRKDAGQYAGLEPY